MKGRAFIFTVMLGAVSAAGFAGTVLDMNLLVNPGFENGLTGWASNGGDDRQSDPAPHGGSNYLYFPNTAAGNVYQVVDVDLGTFSAGDFEVHYGGWQARWHSQTDSGSISVRFLDESGGELASDSLGSFSPDPWQLEQGTVELPEGTARIIYDFAGVRHEGSNLDAYLDDAFLSISAVPEPATLVMLGAGGVLLRKRKR